jgi:glycosyltransferase involved in cell wall biosynthesis
VIGTVGRVVLDKGYREFFAAAERVRAVRPDAAFVVAGQFEERDSVPEDLLRRARAGGVRFLGLRQDIREVYALMDVFALATYREGFPRAAMEAAAMARAMVLTDIRGCREVVTHGRNGWLVPARQAGPLADAILALLEEPSLRGRFGEESRRRAAQEFDERRVFARVIGVYGELLAGRRVSTDQTVGAAGASRRQ